MRSSHLIFALALGAAACKAPDELSHDTDTDVTTLSLAEALPALFTDFEQGCDRLGELVQFVEAGRKAEDIEWEGGKDAQTRSIDPLPHEGLDVTFPEGTDPANQTPVVAFGLSAEGIGINIEVAAEPNQVCIESDSTVYYDRVYSEGSAACLTDGSCDVARSMVEVRKELKPIATGWYDLHVDFRRCTLDDGRTFLAQRAWADKVFPADKPNQAFKQSFVAQLWVEGSSEIGAGKTERVYAIWPEIDIGLPADFMRSTIANSLIEGFENADDYAEVTDGDYASYCPNDRDGEKPPRE
jgi:hypothetical protein